MKISRKQFIGVSVLGALGMLIGVRKRLPWELEEYKLGPTKQERIARLKKLYYEVMNKPYE